MRIAQMHVSSVSKSASLCLIFYYHSIFPSRHQIIYFLIFSKFIFPFFFSSKNVPSLSHIYFHLPLNMVPPVYAHILFILSHFLNGPHKSNYNLLVDIN